MTRTRVLPRAGRDPAGRWPARRVGNTAPADRQRRDRVRRPRVLEAFQATRQTEPKTRLRGGCPPVLLGTTPMGRAGTPAHGARPRAIDERSNPTTCAMPGHDSNAVGLDDPDASANGSRREKQW